MEYPFSVVAVDVGGTKIACAVVRYENADAAPIILSKRAIPTDAQQGGEVVLARILDLVDDVPRLFLMAKPSWALALRRLVVLT